MEIWGIPIIAKVEDIVQVLRAQLRTQNIPLLKDVKEGNKNLQVTCISHGNGQEKKPALGISTVVVHRDGKEYPEGTCHCYSCGYTSDFPTFISNCFGMNDGGMFGFKWLTQNFLNLEVHTRKPIELNMSRTKEKTIPTEYISEKELESYRYTHPYMYERKLTDKVVEYFDVGFDQATNSITFPVKDLTGEVITIQRRAVFGKSFMNEEKSRGEVVFGLYQVYQNLSWVEEVFICESIIDALTCWTHRKAGVSIMGAIPTAKQIRLLKELPVRKMIKAVDNDKAGKKGDQKLSKALGEKKVLHGIHFPDGAKDINELSQEQMENLNISLI